MFWIENAPQLDKSTDEEVCQFTDKYVTCELPSEDAPLKDTVTSVQQHSKRHAKTCKKKNTVCRFHFPRPASARTFICLTAEDESKHNCRCNETPCVCEHVGHTLQYKQKRREQAVQITKDIKLALSDENVSYGSVEQLFASLGISQEIFDVLEEIHTLS